jgi:periplasmic copper chaperone A
MEETMTRYQTIAATVLWLVVIGAGLAFAQEYKVGNLVIERPWSRATPAGAKVAAGYMVITNKGNEADRLLSAVASEAGMVEIHEMAMKDGVMTMRPIAGGLPIEPGKTLTLAPGGYHIMFMDIKNPFKLGEKVTATLQFEKAGKVDVTFDVQPVGAPGPMQGGSGHKL